MASANMLSIPVQLKAGQLTFASMESPSETKGQPALSLDLGIQIPVGPLLDALAQMTGAVARAAAPADSKVPMQSRMAHNGVFKDRQAGMQETSIESDGPGISADVVLDDKSMREEIASNHGPTSEEAERPLSFNQRCLLQTADMAVDEDTASSESDAYEDDDALGDRSIAVGIALDMAPRDTNTSQGEVETPMFRCSLHHAARLSDVLRLKAMGLKSFGAYAHRHSLNCLPCHFEHKYHGGRFRAKRTPHGCRFGLFCLYCHENHRSDRFAGSAGNRGDRQTVTSKPASSSSSAAHVDEPAEHGHATRSLSASPRDNDCMIPLGDCIYELRLSV